MKNFIVILSLISIIGCIENQTEKVEKIENGIKKVGYFLNGKLHGSLKQYDSIGNLISESNYVHGRLEGKHTEYYANGNLLYEMYYKDGRKNGVLTHYQKGGQLWEYLYYSNDTIQYAKIFLPNGEIVHYYGGAEVILNVTGDSLKIRTSLIHSSLKNLETGIILYGNKKQDTIQYKKGDSAGAELIVSKDLFNKYENLSVEVCEIENRSIYVRCNAPIVFSNSKNIYYSEWNADGFEIPETQ